MYTLALEGNRLPSLLFTQWKQAHALVAKIANSGALLLVWEVMGDFFLAKNMVCAMVGLSDSFLSLASASWTYAFVKVMLECI